MTNPANAIAVPRHNAVERAQDQKSHAGNPGEEPRWPHPPDVACDVKHGIHATDDMPFTREQLHFVRNRAVLNPKNFLGATVLQRHPAEAAPLGQRAEAAVTFGAEAARSVEEDLSARQQRCINCRAFTPECRPPIHVKNNTRCDRRQSRLNQSQSATS